MIKDKHYPSAFSGSCKTYVLQVTIGQKGDAVSLLSILFNIRHI